MTRLAIGVAAVMALAAATASMAMVPPDGPGLISYEPTAELYDWYYSSENSQSQFFYKLYGNAPSFGVCQFDLYAPCVPGALSPASTGPYNWTSHVEADGYGGARVWWTADTPGDCLWNYMSPNYTRFALVVPGYVEPTYDYKWPGFDGNTNWCYKSDTSGGSVEGGSMPGVPMVVPEPATLAAVILGCVGALVKKRR